MQVLLSLLFIVVSLFGGFMGAGGNIANLWQPFEIIMLLGSGVGFFIATNTGKSMKQFGKYIKYLFKAPYTEAKFQRIIGLMFQLHALYKKDKFLVSEAVSDPSSSPIFAKYPEILADEDAKKFICNNLNLLIDSGSTISPFTFEDMLDAEIDAYRKEWVAPYKMATALVDTFPALGIAVAVLGISLALQYLDAGMDKLGAKISAALFGTFLGIFVAYGVFKPIAVKFGKFAEEGDLFLGVIKTYIMCMIKNYDPLTAAAVTNKDVPPRYKLDTATLREKLQNDQL
ncbi:MotA/TolQ/ExbB proton channel family protein [Vibrio coralliirubri]|uniref:motility-associated protein n=1 Tax=Vibrio coralliirubri TaxID=1516159 RepID=UPI002284061F|nr:motility-associated protein [Vibrio coralliirubri]MCY9860986.1 MotA/TolQ/ExbB proton channel family protein [Vibrio coralliirubri]